MSTSTVKLLYKNCSKSLITFSYGGQRDDIMSNKELYIRLGAVFFILLKTLIRYQKAL